MNSNNHNDNNVDKTELLQRRLRKDADSSQLDDAFFDRLHNKIMQEVEKTAIKPTSHMSRPKNFLRAHWRGWLYPTSGIISLLAIAFMVVPQAGKLQASLERVGLYSDGQERILTEALSSRNGISQTLITTQTETDFFMDVAAESFENLSIDKLNKIMGEARR